MKTTVSSLVLKDAVNRICKVIPKNPTLQILKGIAFQVKSGNIKLTGFDLDTQICITIAGDSDVEGTFVLDAARLKQITKEFKMDYPIVIEFDTNSAIISSQNGTFQLSVYPYKEYPKWEEFKEGGNVLLKVNSDHLSDGVKKTIKFILNDKLQSKIFSGIYFELSKTGVRISATNLHAIVRVNHVFSGSPMMNFVITSLAASIISDLPDQETSVCCYGRFICFKSSNIEVITLSMVGTYPDLDKFIPGAERYNTIVEFNRKDLIASLNNCCNGKYNNFVVFNINGVCTITHSDVDNVHSEVSVSDFEKIGENIRYGNNIAIYNMLITCYMCLYINM